MYTPYFGLMQSLTEENYAIDWYSIENKILKKSHELPSGAASFAKLMQYAADQISPTVWVNSRRVRAKYLGAVSDMLTASKTEDGTPHDYLMFGLLGNSGPRTQGRPEWLQTHSDPQFDWLTYDENDSGFGKEGIKGNATGRRDHFLANSHIGLPASLLITAFKNLSSSLGSPFEDSTNDWIVNQLGWSFGHGTVVTGRISQQNIGSWISSNMVDPTP
jgi:hypothetical protein